jgi:hypothetical protein
MNPTILNRDFQHPADGWYQIEALGEHPNRAAGVVQVIDGQSAASIVNRFNADAAASQLRHGNELLIDHEHFSDQADQESRAYGWLQELQNRADGIYGRIRWTATGKAAVDGGDYRIFPATPARWKNVSFQNFRTEGAFLVSATLKDGVIGDVTLRSEAGKPCTVVNPWRGRALVVRVGGGRTIEAARAGERLTFGTIAGISYTLTANEL